MNTQAQHWLWRHIYPRMWEDKLSFTQSKFGIWLLGADLPAKTGATTVRLVRLQWHAAMVVTFLKLNRSRASDGSKHFKIRQNSAAREDFPGFLSHKSPFSVAQRAPGFSSTAARFNSPCARVVPIGSRFTPLLISS